MGSLGGTMSTLMSVFALQLGVLLVIGMLAITALSVRLGVIAGKSNAANGASSLQLPRSYADGSVLLRMQLQKSEAALVSAAPRFQQKSMGETAGG